MKESRSGSSPDRIGRFYRGLPADMLMKVTKSRKGTTMKLPDTETLATEFAIVIREWLTVDQLREIDASNAAEPDSSICHSHDVCDPNQAMIDAMDRFNVELDTQSDEQTTLINNAWKIAKTKGFA